LPKEERIQAVTRRKQAGMSNRAIASSLGVHESTVRDDLKSNAGNPAMPEQVTTTDGRSKTIQTVGNVGYSELISIITALAVVIETK